MKPILLALAALAVPALKVFLVPVVAYLSAKLVAIADAYAVKAKAQAKQVKASLILDSLAHFITAGAKKEAEAIQAALAAGKPASDVGGVALSVVKGWLGKDGLAELQDLLGITVGGLDARLSVATSQAVQAQLAVPSKPSA